MKLTKHGYARFKQRQNVKNIPEMERRLKMAIAKGKLIPGGSSRPNTHCYEYAGFHYILSEDETQLITLFRPWENPHPKKCHIIQDLRKRESCMQVKQYLLYEDDIA